MCIIDTKKIGNGLNIIKRNPEQINNNGCNFNSGGNQFYTTMFLHSSLNRKDARWSADLLIINQFLIISENRKTVQDFSIQINPIYLLKKSYIYYERSFICKIWILINLI